MYARPAFQRYRVAQRGGAGLKRRAVLTGAVLLMAVNLASGMEDPRRYDRDFQRFSPEGRLYQVRLHSHHHSPAHFNLKTTLCVCVLAVDAGAVCGEGGTAGGAGSGAEQWEGHSSALCGEGAGLTTAGPRHQREDLRRHGTTHLIGPCVGLVPCPTEDSSWSLHVPYEPLVLVPTIAIDPDPCDTPCSFYVPG